MAFSCTFQLNNGAISPADEVTFIEFIEEAFGKYHVGRVKIAKVLFNGKPAYIYSNSPGFPSGKGTIKTGDKINAETKIAYFSAEGEDIPYGRPYAIIDFEIVCSHVHNIGSQKLG
jgi:hypothetical protein